MRNHANFELFVRSTLLFPFSVFWHKQFSHPLSYTVSLSQKLFGPETLPFSLLFFQEYSHISSPKNSYLPLIIFMHISPMKTLYKYCNNTYSLIPISIPLLCMAIILPLYYIIRIMSISFNPIYTFHII